MSKKLSFARPYAKALSQMVGVEKNYVEWSKFLQFLAIMVQDTKVIQLLRNPLYSTDKIAQWLYESSQSYCPKEGKAFIFLLASKYRLESIPFIYSLFEKTRLQAIHKIAVEVITPKILSNIQKDWVISKLEKLLNSSLEVTCRVDENLLGGFIARTGDRVIDASLQGQLLGLQESLIHAR